MKTLLRTIALLGLIIFSKETQATTITVTSNNGDWAEPSTWNLNRIPGDGDIVSIPSEMTVEISSNLYNAVPRQPALNILIYGKMKMVGEGQINIDCASTICVFGSGSIPSTGCNCNQINLGGGPAEWKGMADEGITGGNCMNGSCALPVNLISFEGSYENGNVNLSWLVSGEANFSHYEIERSTDASVFSKIESVSSTGNSDGQLSYTYTDHYPADQIMYYRLKEVDQDLSFNYSQVIAVDPKASLLSISVSPNPIQLSDQFSIVVSTGLSFSQEFSIVIQDQLGREYFSTVSVIDNQLSLNIDKDLMPGIYTLVVSCSNTILSKKIIVE